MPETEDGIIQIPVQEFDRIFHDLYTGRDLEELPKAYESAYHSGWEDGTKAMHHQIYENSEILIE